MILSSTNNELIYGSEGGGMSFIDITEDDNGQIELQENLEEFYFTNHKIQCLAESSPSLIVVCVSGLSEIQILDR